MCYVDKFIPDRSRLGLPTTASDVAQQAPLEIMLLQGLLKKKEKERRKASEDAAESMERETHTHKGWYLKYRNNDWKEKRAGRHDEAQECRYTEPTGNKVKSK